MKNVADENYESEHFAMIEDVDAQIKVNIETIETAGAEQVKQLKGLIDELEEIKREEITRFKKYQVAMAKLSPERKPADSKPTPTRKPNMVTKKAPGAISAATPSTNDGKMEYGDFLRIERKSRSKKRRTGLEEQITTHWKDEKPWNMVRGSGWFAAPKLLPVVLSILDELAPKGIKLGSTYLALLSLTWEGVPITTIKDESETAMLAGFAGKNRKYAFRQRLALLEELGMVCVVGNPGEWQQVFIKEPVPAIEALSLEGKLPSDSPWSIFLWHYLTHRSL